MRALAENLLKLQELTLSASPGSVRDEIARRRQSVPPAVLAHFDRLLARRRRSVAVVRHGVCGECHLRIPIGTLSSLAAPHDLAICDNCGCYLLLAADDESPPRRSRHPMPVAHVSP